MELARELTMPAQKRALRAWCEGTLDAGGCMWHAVIHQPEGRNDPRNWRAHIVYTTAKVGRELDADGRDTGRFDFKKSDKMPKMVDVGVVLDENGPKKRKGVRELVFKWREAVAEEQNAELEKAGAEKRYDARSYKVRGIGHAPTTHHGASRSALDASGRGAMHRSPEASREWDRVM